MVQKLERYMENKKYYTPEISELHVGYQCDIKVIVIEFFQVNVKVLMNLKQL